MKMKKITNYQSGYENGQYDKLMDILKIIKERIWVWNEEKFGKKGRKEFNKIKEFREELEKELKSEDKQ